MKRVLGLLLAIAVMGSMSMPAFAQEKGKAEAKKAEGKKKGAEGKDENSGNPLTAEAVHLLIS